MLRAIFGFCLALILAAPASAGWYKAESPHFIFYGTSEKDLRDDIERLEKFDQLLRKMTNIPADSSSMKLQVFTLPDMAAVQRAYGGKARDVAGFYRASPSGVIAVVPRGTVGDFSNIVLFHEYAHHLMLHYFPTAYPAWYVEGFAEYLSTTTFEKDVVKIGVPANHRAWQLFQESTVPIETLLSSSVGDLKRGQGGNFYGRAWLLTHYLSFAPSRKGQQAKYLELINKGTPSLDAAKQIFGDLDVLQRDLNKYLNAKSISVLNVRLPTVPVDVKVTALDEGAGNSIMDRIRLTRGTTPEGREPIAARLRQQATKYSGSASVLTLLAEAELDLSNNDAAIKAADAALKIEPTNARALLWRGLALANPLIKADSQDAAKWKEARSWIVKANRANPEDPLPLFSYFSSFRNEGRKPTQIAIDGLGKAVGLLPQVGVYRMSYAFALAEQGEYKWSISLLRPIANSPHGGAMAAAVQNVIARFEAAAAGKEKIDLEALTKSLDGKEQEEE
jgi:tetratricopeptide (TPR) repeat protein